MLYFAYGMNTNKWEMSFRCPKAKSLGPAVLPDHEFRFSIHADVLDMPGMQVEGVLWDITDDCLIALDLLEGYPTYYDRKIVKIMHQGQLVDAMTYYMTGELPDCEPGSGYVTMLIEGYTEHGVDIKQIYDAIEYINRQNSLPNSLIKLDYFV